MTSIATLILAAHWTTGFYVVALTVCGGLLLISMALGGEADSDGADFDGGDLDVDGGDLDLDADVDTELDGMHADGGSMMGLSTWFSMRFVVYFGAMGGGVGTVLSLMTDASPIVVALWAVPAGLVVGQIVHQTLRHLKKTGGNSETRASDYVNQAARVTVSIDAGRRGEVALHIRATERFLSARAQRDDGTFAVGDRVVVCAYTNGVAEVVSREEFEFIHNTTPGGPHEHDSDDRRH
jgi:hypothetical protein